MTGSDYERTFVRVWTDSGWHAQRAASSGGGTAADLPDVTFAADGVAFAAEMKTSGSPHVYVDAAEVAALTRYADAYGMTPVVIGRFKQERAWYFWQPAAMYRTEAGSYRGSQDGDCQVRLVHPDAADEDDLRPEDISAEDLRYLFVDGSE